MRRKKLQMSKEVSYIIVDYTKDHAWGPYMSKEKLAMDCERLDRVSHQYEIKVLYQMGE